MISILVIGGTGFIGRNLLIELVKSNFRCYSLSRNPPSNKLKNVIYLQCDITDPIDIECSLKSLDFDVVVNLGGNVNHNAFFIDSAL